MWLDRRPVYVPGGKYRARILPLGTKVALGGVCLVIALTGDRLIHGYFWLVAHFGELMVRVLQWAGICHS